MSPKELPALRDECLDGELFLSLAEADGDVVERYLYDTYGKVTILNWANGVDKDGAVTEWTEDGDQTASDVENSILYCGYYHDWETGLRACPERSRRATQALRHALGAAILAGGGGDGRRSF